MLKLIPVILLCTFFFQLPSTCAIEDDIIRQHNDRKAYVTVITADWEVNKALVMLSTLFAMTKTKQKPAWARVVTNTEEEHQNEDMQNIDYVCLILPKESFEENYSIWKTL
jgi:hypothetical protein